MSGLPDGWAVCSLTDVGHIVTGKTPSTKEANFYGGSIPFIKPGDLDHSGPVRTTETSLTDAGAAEVPGLPPQSIVVTCIGNLGKVGLTTTTSATNQQINALIPDKGIDPAYVFHYSKTLRPWLEAQSPATTISIVNKSIFSKAPVPLPPAAEQSRIAAKLDELLAQVDTLKARIDGIPARLKRFRQSVLAAAVSGRLTEEWRGSYPVSESAEEYLARVIQCRRQNPIVKFKEPVAPDLEKREIEAPLGWIIASVSNFAECLDSMRVPVKKELRNGGEGKYPYFGANGEVDRVDEYIFDDDLVLVTEDETFYGREKPIAYKYSGKCWVNNHVHALRAHDSVARDYLCYALMHYDVIPWLTGTTGRAKLTQGALLSLPIQVPPYQEQTEIVRRVEQLFAFADQLEARVKAAQTRTDRLTQSTLAKAFRGELVPQDPNDEPASVLLERIKAQRAASPKAKRGRRTATLS